MITISNALIACLLCAALGGVLTYTLRDLVARWQNSEQHDFEPTEFDTCPNCFTMQVRYDVALDMLNTYHETHMQVKTMANFVHAQNLRFAEQIGNLQRSLETVTAERDALARCVERVG